MRLAKAERIAAETQDEGKGNIARELRCKSRPRKCRLGFAARGAEFVRGIEEVGGEAGKVWVTLAMAEADYVERLNQCMDTLNERGAFVGCNIERRFADRVKRGAKA